MRLGQIHRIIFCSYVHAIPEVHAIAPLHCVYPRFIKCVVLGHRHVSDRPASAQAKKP